MTKKCKKCGNFIIKKNDNNAKDKYIFNLHKKHNRICRCRK